MLRRPKAKIKIRIKNFILKLSLQQKLLFVCSISVVASIILISALSITYYYMGMESIFSNQIKKTFNNTVQISHLYMEENINNIRSDILLLANEVDRNFPLIKNNQELMNALLDQQTNRLTLNEAVIFQDNTVLGRTIFSYSWIFDQSSLIKDYETLKGEDGIKVNYDQQNNKVTGIIRLDKNYQNITYNNIYLFISKYIDKDIGQHLIDSKQAAEAYTKLEENIKEVRYKIITVFVIIILGLLAITITFGNKLSKIISQPINQLAEATLKIQKGDYSFRVPESKSNDEVSTLSRAFNQMIETIVQSIQNITDANIKIHERKKFIENFISELTTGIITLDDKGIITLSNNSAIKALKLKDDLSGKNYVNVFPELELIIGNIYNPDKSPLILLRNEMYSGLKEEERDSSRHIEVKIITQHKRHLFIHIAIIYDENNKINMIIVTFDDITNLISAQRFAAWADIARRIAHEIKNPLTPIQLSTERLQKKFSPQITTDKEQFDRYLETIIRRVDDIRIMISEFVEFARISAPKFDCYELTNIIKEVILLQHNQYKNIDYELNVKDEKYYINSDNMQITQVVTNLLKNAAEAIISKEENIANTNLQNTNLNKHSKKNLNKKLNNKTDENIPYGKIIINIRYINKMQMIEVEIIDNGPGINMDMINVICEPYISTKSDGGGLGLSIVKKIIEEHGGNFSISNRNAEDNNNGYNNDYNAIYNSGVIAKFTLINYNYKDINL